MTTRNICSAAIFILLTTPVFAECTYKDAQTKLMQAGNLLQHFNTQKQAMIEKNQPIPPTLDATLWQMGKETSENGQALGEQVADINPTNETIVSSEICTKYDQILKQYQPEDYQAVNIKHSAETPFHCKGEDEATTWDRYSKLLDATSNLDKQKLNTVTLLLAEFGEKMTHDFPAACNLLTKAEQVINQ